MISSLAAGLTISPTTDLSVCAVQGMYISNLYPRDAKTVEMDYASEEWKWDAPALRSVYLQKKL